MKFIISLALLVLNAEFLFALPKDSTIINSDSTKIIKYKYDSWFNKDKAQHAIGSFFMTGFSHKLLSDLNKNSRQKNMTLAVSFSFSLGILKETLDSKNKNNIFSYKDLTADLLGISLAILIFNEK